VLDHHRQVSPLRANARDEERERRGDLAELDERTARRSTSNEADPPRKRLRSRSGETRNAKVELLFRRSFSRREAQLL
jgi:hypothetical protein